MRRFRAAIVVSALLVGMFAAVSVANAAHTVPGAKVSVHVKPHFKKQPPFKFVVSGRVVPPQLTCSGSPVNSYCIPCPPGSSAYYCIPPASKVCAGRVRIRVRLGLNPHLALSGRKVREVFTRLHSNCTYRRSLVLKTSALTSRTPLRRHTRHRTVAVFFRARFMGNAVISGRNSKLTKARAKLVFRS